MVIDKVSAATGIPKGTLWSYISDVELPAGMVAERKRAHIAQLAVLTTERHAKRRAEWNSEMNDVADSVPMPSGESLFFLGMGLYWGEGLKNERVATAFSNSDPRAIRAYLAFLREMDAPMEKLSAGLVIHRDVDKDEAVDFWAGVTGIPHSRIYTSWVDCGPKNSVKRIRGVLNVRLHDAPFSRKMHGWLRGAMGRFTK